MGVMWHQQACLARKDPGEGRNLKRRGHGRHVKVCLALYRQVKSRNMLSNEETSRN